VNETQDSTEGKVAAFFDFDGTIVDGYSALALIKDRIKHRKISPLDTAKLVLTGLGTRTGHAQVEDFMRAGLAIFRGKTAEELDEMGAKFTRSTLGGHLFADALDRITAHQRQGHLVAIASSALPFQIDALAAEIGIEHIICTKLAWDADGRCTGEVDGEMLWGKPKALAVQAFAREHDIDLDASYAYANGDEDVEFLSTVGNPRPVNPEPELATIAAVRGWRVEQFVPRTPASALDMPRTVLAYGGLATSGVLAAGLGLLNRSRRVTANTLVTFGGDLMLGLAGVEVDVIGGQHAWTHRPAVFIFNHQSLLDPLAVFKVVQRDITPIGKKEVERMPLIGQMAWLMNAALVDRTDSRAAKAALQPALDRLADGYSILIAPEGTRSLTARVGEFKKGAFHLSMQGGVPIVPVIIRNSGELMWRGSNSIRSGRLEVLVAPPINTTDWTLRELNQQVAQVRRLYVETLDDWDAAVARTRAQAQADTSRTT
jgi:putative phosphoserine phosphatase/1-acylglycerol-3-phosphate O-acyltransferase